MDERRGRTKDAGVFWSFSTLAGYPTLTSYDHAMLSVFTLAFCRAKAADAPKEGETMVDAIKKTLANLVDNGSPDIRRRLLESDLSTSCSLGLLKLMKGIRNFEPWAVRLIDATGKYPTGLLQGTQSDLGAFDECLETVALDEYGNEKIRGQYCSVYVFPPNDTSLVEALVPAMAMSHPKVCLKSCTTCVALTLTFDWRTRREMRNIACTTKPVGRTHQMR
ncbi:hypothetical protein HPB48_007568 [Haemaphysalis longicornis]|uniref:Nose resistant-to-fluoxetine protein N-terminal domain-containing protein n=1 Tax=Haemaphysalis longicornis TaxID=44386 RepID=A0A9J6FCK5_HAELO|nr:hypothetical protein HPB48_007568 [Haemaphysalis longicornis]